MKKGEKIVLSVWDLRYVMKALRMLKENLTECIEIGCEEGREVLREEAEEVERVIRKMEGTQGWTGWKTGKWAPGERS